MLCLPALAVAAPTQAVASPSASSPESTRASLNAGMASVTATGTFSYTVRVIPARSADSISARFELSDLNGRRIYWRTKYWTFKTNGSAAPVPLSPGPAQDGSYSYTFTNDLSSLNLSPGDYKVSCTIHTSTPERATIQQLNSHLFIYDPAGAPAPAALVLRIGAPPLQRTDGVFASDPATGTAALRAGEISQLSRWVIAHPTVRLTLAPSPLLIGELANIADGCSYKDKSGATVELAASSPAAYACAQALGDLRTALATGRLELAWQGYADPDVGALLQYKLTADITTQYQQGRAVLKTVLGIDPAPVTAPFGGATVEQAGKLLAPLGVKQVLPASYNKVSQSLETSTVVATQALLFSQRGQAKATAVVVGLPLDEPAATALIQRVETLQTCAWIKFQAPDATVLRPITDDPALTYQPLETPRHDFTAIWYARQAALGLASAVDTKDQNVQDAARFSLVAENAFGPHPASAPGAESYATGALRIVRKFFSALSLKMRPVTLAGNSGEVPITVANSTNTQMQVHLEFSAKGTGLKVEPPKSPPLVVAGNEALYSPKVTLHTVGSSMMQVRLMAGGYAICEDSVAISGSYLDIIGIVAIVVIVGAGLVIYIWRHARKVQEGGTRAS